MLFSYWIGIVYTSKKNDLKEKQLWSEASLQTKRHTLPPRTEAAAASYEAEQTVPGRPRNFMASLQNNYVWST